MPTTISSKSLTLSPTDKFSALFSGSFDASAPFHAADQEGDTSTTHAHWRALTLAARRHILASLDGRALTWSFQTVPNTHKLAFGIEIPLPFISAYSQTMNAKLPHPKNTGTIKFDQ